MVLERKKRKILMTREKKFLITVLVFFGLATLDTALRVTLTLCGVGTYTWYFWWYYACGTFSLFAPLMVEKLFKLKMSYSSLIVFECFVIYTIFIGSMWDIYNKVTFYDVVAHTFSGVLFAFIGYEFFTASGKNKVEMIWVFLVVFCFACACGAVWEIIEFVGDALVDGNSQKFMLPGRIPLIGREALRDTMEDIICNTIGAIFASNYLMIKDKRDRKKIEEKATLEAVSVFEENPNEEDQSDYLE